jgi:hypothetical protein
VLRAFLAFDFHGVPRGAAVRRAELVARRQQAGTPYALRGQALLAEAVAWRAGPGGGLEVGDFDSAPVEGTRAVVAAAADGDALQVDVTDLVAAFRGRGAGGADFRLRFAVEPPPPGTSSHGV